jgi:multiple sugar transport system permease protein/putative aldouronate transport system permease protein
MQRSVALTSGKYDRLFNFVNTIFLSFVLIVALYPIIFVISNSFSETSAVMSGSVWLFPVGFTLDGYRAVFTDSMILTGYANTIFYTTVATMLNIVMTIAAAYPLSRKDFRARNPIMLAFTFTMFFSGGMIPTYMLINNLGWINHRIAMIIPVAMTVYNVIITRTFFQSTIPDELLEAARIDGCSDIKFLMSIVIPVSKAIIAVITLFYAVSHWNSFFNAFMYLNDKKLYPLQLVLRQILLANDASSGINNLDAQAAKEGLSELLKYALIVVASVPVLCLYPFIQKYFVKGVMIGSIKG